MPATSSLPYPWGGVASRADFVLASHGKSCHVPDALPSSKMETAQSSLSENLSISRLSPKPKTVNPTLLQTLPRKFSAICGSPDSKFKSNSRSVRAMEVNLAIF